MLDALRELVKQAHDLSNRPVVVFVDTLGDFLKPALRQRKASINDYDAIAEILQALRDLALELGCAFVFVHHTRKAQSEEPNEVDVLGSTAIAGKFDVIAHLQPDRTDTSVLALTVEGNAIAKATLHFAIGDGFRVTLCEPPAKTKEEQAAREIRRLLERHPEGLQRSELIRYLLDIGLAETEDGASRLLYRATKLLPVEAKRSGQRTVYVLTGERLIPAGSTEPTEGKLDNLDTYREFVQLVQHPEKPQQNKAEKVGQAIVQVCPKSREKLDNLDNMDNTGLSNLSNLSNIASEVGQTAVSVVQRESASKIRASAECWTNWTNPIPLSNLSNVQTPELPSPEPTEPVYATLRDDELVDTETLIAELDAPEPTSENPTIAYHRDEGIVQYLPSPCCGEPIEPDEEGVGVCVGCGRRWQWTGASWRPADLPEGDAPTVEDRGDNLSPRKGDPPDSSAPTPADPPPADPAFVDTDQWLAEWASDPPPADPAPLTVTDLETGETLVIGTNAWLEATFSTACPDCGTALTDGACPTCGYPDDRPQWRIGRLVMAIAKALQSRHPQCRSAPCDACRQVVARMNRAVVANDLRGLIALWREVTTNGDAEVSP
jgi:hypothetical protein